MEPHSNAGTVRTCRQLDGHAGFGLLHQVSSREFARRNGRYRTGPAAAVMCRNANTPAGVQVTEGCTALRTCGSLSCNQNYAFRPVNGSSAGAAFGIGSSAAGCGSGAAGCIALERVSSDSLTIFIARDGCVTIVTACCNLLHGEMRSRAGHFGKRTQYVFKSDVLRFFLKKTRT